MAISPELVPEFKEAYRAATGIDRETVREEALKALHKSKGLRRILGYIGESLGVGSTVANF